MSSHTEVPGVNNAVSKLEELATRMKSDDFDFNENDVSNINIVISAIHELEYERRQLHDELETETIKASVNRHKLHFLPAQIKEELMVAVNSARQSNAKAQQELQDKLDNINKNIVFLGERHQELEKENSILHPERELVRQQHEEIISQLNQRMAEKASMQIALNETRDKVRQANQNIVDLEDGILQLKEDLIQERTEARQEKKRLKKAVTDTVEKTKDQREQNMGKKKELDNHQEILFESEQKLDAVRKSIRRFETSKIRLEEEEGNLNKKLTRQLRFIDDLQVKGVKIAEDMEKEEADFAALEEALTAKISNLEGEIVEEDATLEDLEMRKLAIDKQVHDKTEKKLADGYRVSELDNMLQAAKQNLTQKAEEVGRMQAENIEMTEQIEELGESHKAVVNQLNKQLEEFRESLNGEKRDRMDLQSRKDSVQKDLEDLKTDTQRYMQTVNQQIQAGKSKHVELSNEGVQIQKELRKDEEMIQKLRSELAEQERLYEEMFSSLHDKTTKMETSVEELQPDETEQKEEIVSMESDQVEKSEEVTNKTPSFHDLENKFLQREEEYDKMKKEVVVLKNEKTHLEDGIMRVKRQKEVMGPPQGELREDLKQVRSEYLQEMRSQGQEVQDIEKQIYIEGSKLKTVMDENSKFEEGCIKMEADILQLQREMEENEKMTGNLEKELVHCKDALVKSWEDDKVMQEVFANRDEKTIKEFGNLLELTESREAIIANVTGRLAGELDSLSRFLDNVSSRRPKETRSGRRPKLPEKRPLTSSTAKGSNTHRSDSAQEAVKANAMSTGTSIQKSQSIERLADVGISRPGTVRSLRSTPGRTSRS